MQLNHQDIINGKYDDVEVWACSFHYRTLNLSKATRNMPPSKVQLTYIQSQGAFYLQRYPIDRVRINLITKNGEVGKEIPFADNTSSGTTYLALFDNELDCINHYVAMIEKVHTDIKSELGKYIILKNKQLDNIKELQDKWQR